jgi:hypothetical protein
MANEGLILLRKNFDVEVRERSLKEPNMTMFGVKERRKALGWLRSEQKLDVSDGQVTTTIIKE